MGKNQLTHFFGWKFSCCVGFWVTFDSRQLFFGFFFTSCDFCLKKKQIFTKKNSFTFRKSIAILPKQVLVCSKVPKTVLSNTIKYFFLAKWWISFSILYYTILYYADFCKDKTHMLSKNPNLWSIYTLDWKHRFLSMLVQKTVFWSQISFRNLQKN